MHVNVRIEQRRTFVQVRQYRQLVSGFASLILRRASVARSSSDLRHLFAQLSVTFPKPDMGFDP